MVSTERDKIFVNIWTMLRTSLFNTLWDMEIRGKALHIGKKTQHESIDLMGVR